MEVWKLNFVALITIVHREINRFMRIWTQSLVPPIITQSLYFIIFGGFIGSQISDINGVSYMSFIVPGLIMMSVINSSFMNVVSSFFGSKFQKNIEELLVSPVPVSVVIAGYAMGGVARGLLVGLIVFLVSAIFVSPAVYNFGIVLLFIISTSIVFSLAGLLNAIFAKKFDDVNIFPTFILTPLTYFGGVFYSIQNLPEFWQMISKFNPILYMVDGFRYGFHGFSDLNIWLSLLMLSLFGIVLWSTCYVLIKRGVGLRS